MRKSARITLVLLTACFLALVTWRVTVSREPVWQGEPVMFWIRSLSTNTSAADQALRGIGVPALPHLVEAFENPNRRSLMAWERIRRRMPGLLWRFFPTPFPWAVIHREVTVEIGTIGSQYRFSDGIGEVGTTPEIEEAVRALAGGLNASDSGERTSCALALAFIGPNARHASADLAEMFKRRDISEKLFVCQAFGTIGACPEAKESVKILTDALTTSNHVLKQYVADALANIGPLASVATPTLANMLTNDDPHLRKSAVRALARIGNVPADTRPRLLSLLKSPEPFTRAGAAVALLRFDSNDVAAIGFVRDCLAPDKESSLRSSTVYLIMDSEPLVRIFLTDIRQLTNDPDIPVAMFSRKAMKQIKPEVVAAGDK